MLTAFGIAATQLANGWALRALGMAAFMVRPSATVGTVVSAILPGGASCANAAATCIGVVFRGALLGVLCLSPSPALVVIVNVAVMHPPTGTSLATMTQARCLSRCDVLHIASRQATPSTRGSPAGLKLHA